MRPSRRGLFEATETQKRQACAPALPGQLEKNEVRTGHHLGTGKLRENDFQFQIVKKKELELSKSTSKTDQMNSPKKTVSFLFSKNISLRIFISPQLFKK